MMNKKFPILPKHPERICWGCDRFCPASDMACGNGADRTAHPSELFGEDWLIVDPTSATQNDDIKSVLHHAKAHIYGLPTHNLKSE
jgi:hypothetical protein